MTLTIDEVRQVQFHESRRRGYEVTDVDLFVDRVEASFEKLIEENDALKQEIEALKKAKTGGSQSEPAALKTSDAPAAKDAEKPSSVTDDTAEQPAVRVGASEKTRAAEPSSQTTVVTTAAEASPAVIRLVQMATEQAETLVSEAEAQAAQTRESADAEAQQVLADAKREARDIGNDASTRAEQIESEARDSADKVRGEAQSQADNLKSDLEKRRAELFTDLDRERDDLVSAVAQLREFEQSYRGNLTEHLQGQLETVRNGRSEPGQVPALANVKPARKDSASSQDSSTPRLDALLGDRYDA